MSRVVQLTCYDQRFKRTDKKRKTWQRYIPNLKEHSRYPSIFLSICRLSRVSDCSYPCLSGSLLLRSAVSFFFFFFFSSSYRRPRLVHREVLDTRLVGRVDSTSIVKLTSIHNNRLCADSRHTAIEMDKESLRDKRRILLPLFLSNPSDRAPCP